MKLIGEIVLKFQVYTGLTDVDLCMENFKTKNYTDTLNISYYILQ